LGELRTAGIAGLALALSVLPATFAAATEIFPSRPIKIIVGPSPDVFSRNVGEHLQQTWGQPVVVEPRTGAGARSSSGVPSVPLIGRPDPMCAPVAPEPFADFPGHPIAGYAQIGAVALRHHGQFRALSTPGPPSTQYLYD
jgi:hypothetical protein